MRGLAAEFLLEDVVTVKIGAAELQVWAHTPSGPFFRTRPATNLAKSGPSYRSLYGWRPQSNVGVEEVSAECPLYNSEHGAVSDKWCVICGWHTVCPPSRWLMPRGFRPSREVESYLSGIAGR